MDIMDEDHSALDALAEFDLSPTAFPWSAPVQNRILARRDQLEGELFFDRLLELAGIEQTLYPPQDIASFRRLHSAIQTCNWDTLKRSCLIYYLLKWWGDKREEGYAYRTRIPPHFVGLADAYYCLDVGNVQSAVFHLCDARIKPDDTLKIMKTIALASDPTTVPPGGDPNVTHPESTAHLIVRYVRMARPVLSDPDEQDIYIVSLCHVSFTDAFLYQRTFPANDDKNSTRHRLMQKLLQFCFIPKPRAGQLQILVALPLSPFEESFLHSFAAAATLPDAPEPQLSEASLAVLHDLIIVRLIHLGQYAIALRLDKEFSIQVARSHASTGRTTSRALTQKAEERAQMLKDIVKALPAVQRTMLEGGDPAAVSEPTAMASSISGATGLAMSWEDLGTPRKPLATAARSSRPSFPTTPLRKFTPSKPSSARGATGASAGSPFVTPATPWTAASGTPMSAFPPSPQVWTRSGAPSASPSIPMIVAQNPGRSYPFPPSGGAHFSFSSAGSPGQTSSTPQGTPINRKRNAFYNPTQTTENPLFPDSGPSSGKGGTGTPSKATPSKGMLGKHIFARTDADADRSVQATEVDDSMDASFSFVGDRSFLGTSVADKASFGVFSIPSTKESFQEVQIDAAPGHDSDDEFVIAGQSSYGKPYLASTSDEESASPGRRPPAFPPNSKGKGKSTIPEKKAPAPEKVVTKRPVTRRQASLVQVDESQDEDDGEDSPAVPGGWVGPDEEDEPTQSTQETYQTQSTYHSSQSQSQTLTEPSQEQRPKKQPARRSRAHDVIPEDEVEPESQPTAAQVMTRKPRGSAKVAPTPSTTRRSTRRSAVPQPVDEEEEEEEGEDSLPTRTPRRSTRLSVEPPGLTTRRRSKGPTSSTSRTKR